MWSELSWRPKHGGGGGDVSGCEDGRIKSP